MNEGVEELRVAGRHFQLICIKAAAAAEKAPGFLNSFTVRLCNTWPIFLKNPQISLHKINLYIPHINKNSQFIHRISSAK